MDSSFFERDGFAMGRMWNAAKPTASTLGQSDIMQQARKLLIYSFGPVVVSRAANVITMRGEGARAYDGLGGSGISRLISGRLRSRELRDPRTMEEARV